MVALQPTPGTKRTRAAKRPAGKRNAGGTGAAKGFVPGPEFSANMVAKAKRLVNNGQFARLDKGTCQVASSDGGSYLASAGPNSCQCMSFKTRRVCSHVLVVQIVDAASEGGDVDGNNDGTSALKRVQGR